MKPIILLMGKSGSGKSSIAALCETYGMKSLRSYATRPCREDEADAGTHIFVTDEEFDKLTDFVAYTEFNGYRYAAIEQQVEESDIYVIDVNGAREFYNRYVGNKRPICIYIDVDASERFYRMTSRGDSIENAINRIEHDAVAFAGYKDFATYCVPNDTGCAEKVAEFIFNIYKYSTET